MQIYDDLSTVNAEVPRWVWPGRIPAATLTLLVGSPERGKSTLTADLAARLSVGCSWPDGLTAPRGDTLFLVAEDSITETLVPKLLVADADRRRIVAVSGGEWDIITPQLRTRRYTLCICDPLTAFLPGYGNERKARADLSQLLQLAIEYDVAILGVLHLTKTPTRDTIRRVLGSVAYAAVPRSILAAESLWGDTYRLLTIKHNLCPRPPDLYYHFERASANGVTAPRVVWDV